LSVCSGLHTESECVDHSLLVEDVYRKHFILLRKLLNFYMDEILWNLYMYAFKFSWLIKELKNNWCIIAALYTYHWKIISVHLEITAGCQQAWVFHIMQRTRTMLFIFSYNCSSGAEQVLPGSEGGRVRWWGRGSGGEMTQTMYANVSKWIIKIF
jgi:hypothetical protein